MVFDLLLSFIKQHVGIFYFFFDFESANLSSKCFFSELPNIETSDCRIIEFIPFSISFSLLNERVVMSTICIANVDGDSLEDVIIVGIWKNIFFIELVRVFLLPQILLGIFLDIKFSWELAVVIDLHFVHSFEIKLKSLQSQEQMVR